MAQGLVTFTSMNLAQRVQEVKVTYMNMKRVSDRLIALRNGTDYVAVATAVGSPIGTGQTVFDNIDAAIAGLTTAYNALSNMDVQAL